MHGKNAKKGLHNIQKQLVMTCEHKDYNYRLL